MSDAPKSSTAGVLSSLGERLIVALPPAFLLCVLLNIGFLGFAAWSFNANVEARNVMLARIIDGCLLERKER